MPSELRRLDESFGVLIGEGGGAGPLRRSLHRDAALWRGRVAQSGRTSSRRCSSAAGARSCSCRPAATGRGRSRPCWSPGTAAASRPAPCAKGWSFIEQAARTVVLVVDPPTDAMPWAEVEGHLARHGVVAEVVTAESQDRRIAESSSRRRAAFPRISSSWEPTATPA